MMLLFFLLTAVSAAVPPLYLDTSSNFHSHPSPFYPGDDTRIRWTQCADHGKTLCFQSTDCKDPNSIATEWEKFERSKLTEIHRDKTYACSSGQMIRPINASYWLVYFQFAAPGLNQTSGIKLYLESGDIQYVFGKCAYNESAQEIVFSEKEPKDPKQDPNSEKNIKTIEDYYIPPKDDEDNDIPLEIKIKTELLHGFVDEYEMSCVFSIKATGGPTDTIETQLKKVFAAKLKSDRPNNFKTSRLITEIERFTPGSSEDKNNPHNYDNGVVEQIKSPDTIENTVKDLTERVGRGLKKEKVVKIKPVEKDVEFKRNFTYEEVNTDFNSMGCSDKAARLVIHQNNGLREATKDYLKPENTYFMWYLDKTKTKEEDFTNEISTTDFHVGCIKRACLECDPLPPLLLGCDGCSPPLVKLPMNHRDCPVLKCDSNQWIFDDIVDDNMTSSRDEYGIQCRKSEDDKPGWYRSNGVEVKGAACAPIRNCTILSPLNAIVCNGVDTTNECVLIANDSVTCPDKMNLVYHDGHSFQLMESSLHCDFFTGNWYFGRNTHMEFNTTIQLICQARQKEKFNFLDKTVFVTGALVAVAIAFIVTPIFIAIAYCWRESRKSHLKYRLRPVNPYKRAVTQWPPTYADLTEVVDIMATPKADFYGIIQEWPMYSIVERVKFCTNLLDELGLTVKIDHYLSLFFHCVQMESDHRVWRKLILGYKMILVGFNSVNRSRVAMKFQADLILGMNRLLNRLGQDHVDGADESLNFVRDMCYNTFIACNNAIGIQHLIEEGDIRDGCEDIRKRRQIFAARMRADGGQTFFEQRLDEIAYVMEHQSHTKIMYGIPMPDDDAIETARRDMRRRQGIYGETQAEQYWKIMAEREAKKKYDELVPIYGSYPEHVVYALCCGSDPDVVTHVIGVVASGEYTARALVNCFRACIEDCFDMRFGAREAFIKHHSSVREKCPIGSAEYMEIFEMFMRFSHLEYNETDETWLMKHVGNPGYFDQGDKEFLPITRMSEQAEFGRKFMAMLQQYKIKHILRRGEYQKDDETPRAHSPVRPMAALPDPKAAAGTESALRSDELEPYQSSGPGSSDNGGPGPGPTGSTTKSNQRSDTKSKAASASASRSKQGTASNSSAPKPDTASNSKQEPGPGPGSKPPAPGPAK